jgi:hypothetical protein
MIMFATYGGFLSSEMNVCVCVCVCVCVLLIEILV